MERLSFEELDRLLDRVINPRPLTCLILPEMRERLQLEAAGARCTDGRVYIDDFDVWVEYRKGNPVKFGMIEIKRVWIRPEDREGENRLRDEARRERMAMSAAVSAVRAAQRNDSLGFDRMIKAIYRIGWSK